MIPSVINFSAVVSAVISSFGSTLGVIVGGIICFIILRIAVDRWLIKIEEKRNYESMLAEQN